MDSLTDWSRADAVWFGERAAVSTVLVWVGTAVAAVGIDGLVGAAAPYWLAHALLTVVVLGCVVVRSRWTGTKLVVALSLLYVGLRAVSFVELVLYGLQSADTAAFDTVGSAATAVLTVVVVVAAFGGFSGTESAPTDERLRLSPVEWAWKLALLALVFLATFLGAGLFVFEPVARLVDPQAYATYEILDPPAWIFAFQLVRGVVFTLLLLPVVSLLRGSVRETQLTVALTFAVLLSGGLLLPNETVPGLLWVAHFVEVFSSSFVYGLVLVPLVSRHHHPLRWIFERVPSADAAG